MVYILPYIDQIIAIIIALIMMPQPFRIMRDVFRNLILFAPEEELICHNREIAETEFERYSYVPTFYNIIQTGRKLWVEIYFETTRT